MPKRVVLFQPSCYQAGTAGLPLTPLALLHLAAAMDQAGHESIIIDADTDPNYAARLADEAARADAVGITTMSGHQLANAIADATRLRAACPTVPLIWGGWHPSMEPEQTAADPLVDLVVRGPGEQTLAEVLAGTPADWPNIAGLTWRAADGKIRSTADRLFAGLDPDRQLPWPKLNMAAYGGRPIAGDDHGENFSVAAGAPFMYISSRGCAYRCRFCQVGQVYKRKWHGIPADKVVDELAELNARYGIAVFSFVDPEFFLNIGRVRAIVDGILRRGLKIFWKAQVRYEHIVKLGEEWMKRAHQSGCRQLEIGAETGSPEMVQRIAKDADPAVATEAARICRRAGVIAQFNLIFGWPFEQPRHVRENFQFAARLKQANPECLLPLYFLVPLPRTEIMADCVARGYQEPKTLREYAGRIAPFGEPTAPWIADKPGFKDLMYRVIVFYLPLAFPGEVTRGTLKHVRSRMRNWPDLLWLWPAHLLARLRVALGFYSLPIEWRLFNWIARLKRPAASAARADKPAATHQPLKLRVTQH